MSINLCTGRYGLSNDGSAHTLSYEEERGVAVSGCCNSVAEHLQIMSAALSSTPSSTSFLTLPLPLRRSSDSNDPDCFNWTISVGLRTMEEPCPSGSSCCEPTHRLSPFNIYTQQLITHLITITNWVCFCWALSSELTWEVSVLRRAFCPWSLSFNKLICFLMMAMS